MSSIERQLREINEKLFVINQKLDEKFIIPQQKQDKSPLPPILPVNSFVSKLHKIPHDAQKYDVSPSNPHHKK